MINGDDDLDKAEEKFNRDDAAFSDRHKVNTITLNSYIANLTGSIARAEALSKSSDNANMVICFDYLAKTFEDNLERFKTGKQDNNSFGMKDPSPNMTGQVSNKEYYEALSLVVNRDLNESIMLRLKVGLPEVDLDQIRVALNEALVERKALEDKAYHEFIEKFGAITACETWTRWKDSRAMLVHQEMEKFKAYEKDLKAKAKSDLAAAKAKVKKNKGK